jgi:hypothetical protein
MFLDDSSGETVLSMFVYIPFVEAALLVSMSNIHRRFVAACYILEHSSGTELDA